MEDSFNEKESLKRIDEMILKVKEEPLKRVGNMFLFWGYVVAITSLVSFTLENYVTGYLHENSYFVWLFVLPVSWIIYFLFERKKKHNEKVKTYTASIIKNTWAAFGFSTFTIWLAFVLMSYFEIHTLLSGSEVQWYFMCPIMILLNAGALYVTGIATRMRTFKTAAILAWLLVVPSLFLPAFVGNVSIQFIFLSAVMIIGFIIPGHLLNKKANIRA